VVSRLGSSADIGLTERGKQTTARHHRAAELPFGERRRRHPRILWAAGLAVVGLVLYFYYLRQAQTYELNSDPAGQALQAWQLWHGNLLLRGWWLGYISFYGIELPLNVIVEMVSGLRPDEVHILAALVYAAVVLLTGLLARGTARGREGVVRALLAEGILLAPSLQYGTQVLMQGPDHTGTLIPVLLMMLVLDRAPERWWVPAVVGVMLTWGQVNDRSPRTPQPRRWQSPRECGLAWASPAASVPRGPGGTTPHSPRRR
jgi:hypothetical protein